MPCENLVEKTSLTIERSTSNCAPLVTNSSRMYGALNWPTRSVTPTGELLLAPGKRRLRLVPPTGAPIEQVVDIEKKSATDAPQRITPDMRGS